MSDLPDKNIFMMCRKVDEAAFSELPKGFLVRNCRKDELDLWKAMPFDNLVDAIEHKPFMDEYFEATYGRQRDLFFEKTLFVCDLEDRPIATCLIWKAYNQFNSIHWFKVLKGFEGLGIGRALFTILMKDLKASDFPIYLHTQPESFRAVKLYSNFGFHLLSNKKLGVRHNDLDQCLPILKTQMPQDFFEDLEISEAPQEFEDMLKDEIISQF